MVMGPGEHLARLNAVALPSDEPLIVTVGADDATQHLVVTGIPIWRPHAMPVAVTRVDSGLTAYTW